MIVDMMTIEVTMMTVMMTVDVIAREILQENVPVIDLGMITQEVMTILSSLRRI